MQVIEFDFRAMGETDVREEILAPLIRHLGYRSGSEHHVIREQWLTHKQLQLGRRSKDDPYLKGKADYVCIAGGRVSWVVEAKAGSVDIGQEDIDQAWSYASHPEIRAVYFLVSNGREFQLFQSSHGYEAKPIFQYSYEELQANLATVMNTLSPHAVLRAYPTLDFAVGKPLGEGLRSVARITGGSFSVLETVPPIPAMTHLSMAISEGSIERLEDGTLKAHVLTSSPFRVLQELSQAVGNDRMELYCLDHTLSADPSTPSRFEGLNVFTIPQGAELATILDVDGQRRISHRVFLLVVLIPVCPRPHFCNLPCVLALLQHVLIATAFFTTLFVRSI
jgi:hypothetical protein